jgi:hypothetical protein
MDEVQAGAQPVLLQNPRSILCDLLEDSVIRVGRIQGDDLAGVLR